MLKRLRSIPFSIIYVLLTVVKLFTGVVVGLGDRLRRIFPKLIAKLRGYNNYNGLIGNYSSLSKFHEQVKRILYKWLNRRSQRRSFNLAEFSACCGVPKPRIVESNLVQLYFDF